MTCCPLCSLSAWIDTVIASSCSHTTTTISSIALSTSLKRRRRGTSQRCTAKRRSVRTKSLVACFLHSFCRIHPEETRTIDHRRRLARDFGWFCSDQTHYLAKSKDSEGSEAARGDPATSRGFLVGLLEIYSVDRGRMTPNASSWRMTILRWFCMQPCLVTNSPRSAKQTVFPSVQTNCSTLAAEIADLLSRFLLGYNEVKHASLSPLFIDPLVLFPFSVHCRPTLSPPTRSMPIVARFATLSPRSLLCWRRLS